MSYGLYCANNYEGCPVVGIGIGCANVFHFTLFFLNVFDRLVEFFFPAVGEIFNVAQICDPWVEFFPGEGLYPGLGGA
jgi:hypothetical protein